MLLRLAGACILRPILSAVSKSAVLTVCWMIGETDGMSSCTNQPISIMRLMHMCLSARIHYGAGVDMFGFDFPHPCMCSNRSASLQSQESAQLAKLLTCVQVLKEGDVITHFNGHNIADDG